MNAPITEAGIIALFAWNVIKEILAWKSKASSETVVKLNNGEKYIPRAEFREFAKEVQYAGQCEQIVKRIESEFRAIEERDNRRVAVVDENFKRMDRQFDRIGTLIKNGNG